MNLWVQPLGIGPYRLFYHRRCGQSRVAKSERIFL